jgi:hypothetical protein
MKGSRLVIMILAAVLIMSCGGNSGDQNIPAGVVNNPNTAENGSSNADKLPVMAFDKEEHDFGRLIQGEQVTYAFKFKNTGKADLVISSARASCGCTVPSYPKTPVKPGEEGVISVQFNTEGRKGMQSKTITLMANTQPNTKVLTIKAEVYLP